MIVKLLGLVDILCVITIWAHPLIPNDVVMNIGMLLAMKGVIFSSMRNWMSFLDVIGAIYIGMLVYGFNPTIFMWFYTIYLGQKGLLSLLAR